MYKRNKLFYLLSSILTQIGDRLFEYASRMWIAATFTTATPLAIFMSIETIINGIFNVLGGALADKLHKKRMLIITDTICFIACVILFFLASNLSNISLLVGLCICNAILALAYSFYSPTIKSIVADILHKDQIKNANSIINVASQLISVSTPLSAMFVYLYLGIKYAILINAISFLISALLETRILYTHIKPEKQQSIWQDFVDGAKYVYGNKNIFKLLIIVSVINFSISGYNLVLPLIGKTISNNFYGVALTTQTIGGLLGSFIALHKATDKLTTRFIMLSLGVFIAIFSFLLLYKSLYFISFITPFMLGFLLSLFNVKFITRVQLETDKIYLGRVFSFIFTIAIILMPLGNYFYSISYNFLGIYSFVIAGATIFFISLFLRNL